MSGNKDSGPKALDFLIIGTFLVLLTAKLAGWVTWSWWWITAPLWGGLALILVLAIFFALILTVKGYREARTRKIKAEADADQKWEEYIHGYGSDEDQTKH